MENNGNNGWLEYKQRVLYQLDELSNLNKEMNRKLDDLRSDVVILKVKASFYGAVGGLVFGAVIPALIRYFDK